ncbi:Calcium-binding EF-hand-containing protein [Psychromonas ingrahamii 37]|uniref:Calcium-binding EF-hand-containing protein n=1 Tax=Psychromonas ingrahamii (strain DSM 17664 / CCUG 51855 / 37) TaxID=357804 RepID=A1STL5_PSYIN|nr:calcium-binding EF-hand-containing protein [Psychromonas ingrahamii]ABM02830.1 Calcium-binding EF-hand-containing protein [Psychromonas ingrahamii 37]
MKKLLLITGALLMATTHSTFAAEQNQNAATSRVNKHHMTFAQLDANADGVLSKDEVRGRLLANFDSVDSDASGTLSTDEFNARVEMGKQGHHKDHHQKNGYNHPTFAQLDINNDSFLAKDEVRGRLLAHFDNLDSDASGTLSADEFNARFDMGKQGRQGHHKGNRDYRPNFEQLDLDGDGVLSAEEFNAVVNHS